MKKFILSGLLCAGLAVSLCACGSKEATESTEAVEQTEDTNIYAYDYDAASYVELGEYKNLTYTIVDTTVTDEEVDAEIALVLKSHATKEQITDRAVEDGDYVNIDFEGLLDGEPFEGGTSEGYTLGIGTGTFIPGFEEGLIGSKPGDELALDITFPEEYPTTELAGKPVVFNIKVNYIEGEEILPELNDEFVKSLSIAEVSNVDDYKVYTKNQLQQTKESEAQTARRSELFKQVYENAKVKDYPEEFKAQYVSEFKNYYDQYATMMGVTLPEFLEQYLQMTEEEYEAEAENYGKETTGNFLILCAIAEAEGIEITDEIYEEELIRLAEENDYEDTSVLESEYSRKYLTQIMINDKVIELIESSATGVEAAETEE